jgi:O-antigen/teichoic acid export membrane protein/peptidoglycan/xylan/chitin deacetylase (PgdA/CDA1 family)
MNKDATACSAEGIDSGDMSGRNRIAWNIVYSWGGYLVYVAAGFVMPRYIDRHIGHTALGVWDFAWSLVSYLGLTPLGIGNAVNRQVAWYRSRHDYEGLRRLVSSVLCVQVLAAGVAFALTTVAAFLVPSLLGHRLDAFREESVWVVFYLGTAVSVQIGFDAFRGVITGYHRWDLHNGLNAGCYAVIVASMMLVLSLGGGLQGIALAYLCGIICNEITRAVMAYRVCPELRVRWQYVSRNEIVQMWRFGAKIILLTISSLLLYQSNSMLIAVFLGPAALALYSRPMNLIRQVNTIVSKYGNVFVPTASVLHATGRRDELRELLSQSTLFASAISLPMILVLIFMGDPILRVWMGPSYQQGIILAILSIGHFFAVTQEPVVSFLVAANAHGGVGLFTLLGSILSIALGAITIAGMQWGLIGAALSISIPLILVRAVYIPFYAVKQFGLQPREFFERTYGVPVLCAIPFAVCMLLGRWALAPQTVTALVCIVLAGAVSSLPLYWRYIVPAEDRKKVLVTFYGLISRGGAVVRLIVRMAVTYTLYCSGILSLWRYFKRNRIIILVLHGTYASNVGNGWQPLRSQLAAGDLDSTMRVLSRHYQFISLQAAVRMISGREPVRPNSVVLTFDDGYRNNITEALPILRKYKAPATLFPATGHVDRRKPYWFDRLDYVLQRSSLNGRSVRVGGRLLQIDADDRCALQASYRELRVAAKAMPRHDYEMLREVEDLADALESETDQKLCQIFENDRTSAVLTWDEIGRASRHEYIDFGSHTVDHVRLAMVDEEIARTQLMNSKQMLERNTQRTCDVICYPDGSFDRDTLRIARECGYTAGVTMIEGTNKVGDDLLKLRRIPFPNSSRAPEVLVQVLNVYGFVNWVRASLGRVCKRRSDNE